MKKASLVVMISGNGSNLQAIIDAIQAKNLPAEIKAVISNTREAYGLERAKQAGIPTTIKAKRKDQDREQYDAELADIVKTHQPDFVILAGWMRILTMSFISAFPNRIINLHPALPGTFPGVHAIERAWQAYQNKEISHTGVMVHLVPDEGVDLGPVLAQKVVDIYPKDTLEDLEKRVHHCEHELLVETIHKTILQTEENNA
ncbi:MAG: phosphoribosylglycinamide formyltransferase [Chloroflexi bacterium HGW-Chloroflexi-4]|jgi:phosphoribosylglycinamide formyltransferase-1|nr:MAG: phosphoribosylglycinamide formyltransferase [Chloroflexi bacterium HGW-Chloroflexi-4]